LKAVCQGALPNELSVKLGYVEAILAVQRMQATLKEHEGMLKELFGGRWQKLKSDWTAMQAAAAYLHDVYQQVAGGQCPKELLAYLQKHEAPSVARENHAAVLSKLNDHGRRCHLLMEKLQMNEAVRFTNGSFQHQSFSSQLALVKTWQENILELHKAVSWNNLADSATGSRTGLPDRGCRCMGRGKGSLATCPAENLVRLPPAAGHDKSFTLTNL
jgi:hypothetical protein